MPENVDISIRWRRPSDFAIRMRDHPKAFAQFERDSTSMAGMVVSTGVKQEITDQQIQGVTGLLRQRVRWYRENPQTAVVDSAVDYAEYQDVGAGPSRITPGPRGRWWPPVQPIRLWVKRKNIHRKFGVSIDSATFLVRRAIWRRGIRPREFMRKGLERSWDNVQRQLDKFLDDTMKRLGFS